MKYDKFQLEAINFIEQGYSVIVSAPTGAGKTIIAEFVIHKCLTQNDKVIYTAPIKALSNQKFRDFQKIYPDKIGILTGDVSINSEAPVLIMTTEIFRNKVLEEPKLMESYKWIIFDEVHYLDDIERGTVWEESIIFLPTHIHILALSATIPNIDELASWINSIHKTKLKVVKEDMRPVPLRFYFHCQKKLVDNLDNLSKIMFTKKHHTLHKYTGININNISELIDYMKKNNKLPCIYFSFNRRRCEELANMIGTYNFLTPKEENQITQLFDSLCLKFDLTREKNSDYLFPLIRHGIAYHHAGMLPTLKEVIERLFTSGLLKVIFTTETFALGINMPARSVVFDDLCKNYGNRWQALKTRDFYQMAGRAGRRGIDNEGFVWCRVNPKLIRLRELKKIINAQPEIVVSQLNTSYATLLHLYNDLGEALYDIYPCSFHYFQSEKKDRDRVISHMKARINILKELGHIRDNKLTPKGIFSSQIYGYELSMGELFDKGYLDRVNKYELGILILSFVYEPRRHRTQEKESINNYKWIKKIVDREIKKIISMERNSGIKTTSKEACFQLSTALKEWMKGENFDNIVKHAGEDEGEIVRYFRMTTQILKEIQSEKCISDSLRSKANQTFKLINRDVIDAEKQLRTV